MKEPRVAGFIRCRVVIEVTQEMPYILSKLLLNCVFTRESSLVCLE